MRKRLVVHRLVSRAVQLALRQPARHRHAPPAPGPVRFLVMDLHERGGSVRSNLLLAGGLAQQHRVEVLSAFVKEQEPFYPLPPGVGSRVLDDRRPAAGRLQRALSRVPSLLVHPDDRSVRLFTLWTDVQVLRALRALDGGWLITTRPGLHLLAARFAPPGVVVVAREHDNFTKARPGVRTGLVELARGIDALSTLTRADERDYADLLGERGVHVFQAPNALAPLDGEPRRQRDPVVLAAGRLVRQKGFDLLLEAFAPIARDHLDWRLEILGEGNQREALAARVRELGLAGSVHLRPPTPAIGEEMARAGVYVLSSRFEGFGRVVIEAMSKALPVVSFDCPRGPGEIITDGHDGLLVAPEDVAALSSALRSVVEDEALRRRLGEAGPATAQRYDLGPITARWEAELETLAAARAGRARQPPR